MPETSSALPLLSLARGALLAIAGLAALVGCASPGAGPARPGTGHEGNGVAPAGAGRPVTPFFAQVRGMGYPLLEYGTRDPTVRVHDPLGAAREPPSGAP